MSAYIIREPTSAAFRMMASRRARRECGTQCPAKEELTDCVLVVTRYFGGILLGGGGLVRAYSHAAKIIVDAGGIVTRAECSIVKIRCDYTFYGRLASLIPEQGGIVEDTAFEDVVTVKMRIPQELEPAFEARLIDLSNGTCRGEITDTVLRI